MYPQAHRGLVMNEESYRKQLCASPARTRSDQPDPRRNRAERIDAMMLALPAPASPVPASPAPFLTMETSPEKKPLPRQDSRASSFLLSISLPLDHHGVPYTPRFSCPAKSGCVIGWVAWIRSIGSVDIRNRGMVLKTRRGRLVRVRRARRTVVGRRAKRRWNPLDMEFLRTFHRRSMEATHAALRTRDDER